MSLRVNYQSFRGALTLPLDLPARGTSSRRQIRSCSATAILQFISRKNIVQLRRNAIHFLIEELHAEKVTVCVRTTLYKILQNQSTL